MDRHINSDGVKLGENTYIGEFTIIGTGSSEDNIVIGRGTRIGNFCFIDKNVTIGDNCYIGDGVYIYSRTFIGNNVRLISKTTIDTQCNIGNNCIIDAIVSNKVIMEESVRFFGSIAHSHRNHTLDWKTTQEPSPIFRKGSIIGVGALIIGPIEVGENAYVSAGEVIRCDLPANHIYFKNQIIDKLKLRGFII